MKYFRQILLLLLFTTLSELLHCLIPAPIPASIYGMVLVFLALSLNIIRVEAISDVGNFLVSILPVLFVAPLASLMDYWGSIKDDLIPIFLIIFASTILVFVLSGWVTQLLMKKGGKQDD